jgi:hypothetical protein
LIPKNFDTDVNFAYKSYSFTPNVAGYYQLEFLLCFDPLTANEVTCFVFKNGIQHKRGTRSQASGQALYLICSTLVYANGTTDYFDAYAYQSTGSNKNLEAGLGAKGNYFQRFFGEGSIMTLYEKVMALHPELTESDFLAQSSPCKTTVMAVAITLLHGTTRH